MSNFIPIAKASDIADQSARVVDIKGKRIALFNLAGEFYAAASALLCAARTSTATGRDDSQG